MLRAGETFSYSEAGPEGLLAGKRVIVVESRGGLYSEGPAQAIDFQEPYLRHLLGFMGLSDVTFVHAEKIGYGPEARAAAIAAATSRAAAGVSSRGGLAAAAGAERPASLPVRSSAACRLPVALPAICIAAIASSTVRSFVVCEADTVAGTRHDQRPRCHHLCRPVPRSGRLRHTFRMRRTSGAACRRAPRLSLVAAAFRSVGLAIIALIASAYRLIW